MKSFTLSALFSAFVLAASVCAAPVEHAHPTSVGEPATPTPSHPVAVPDIFRWRRDTTPPSPQPADGSEDSPLVANGIFLWRRDTTPPSTHLTADAPEDSPSSLTASSSGAASSTLRPRPTRTASLQRRPSLRRPSLPPESSCGVVTTRSLRYRPRRTRPPSPPSLPPASSSGAVMTSEP
ncbi:uncharacterized protein B0H18DRAFT_393406 [Fomitopsis serialis]|uniref:uncharacterized protein n=1 Tax=Fomitopsis serialis TaxID=139415 RepID=UPI002008D8B5|nr:uncharacterized protein B0H18DRAFT_393406 [Neoantrodia serialis]KAH9924842.1 hypothetical protein B0H18DRAFT_393406 [Neoantrodia serialis]